METKEFFKTLVTAIHSPVFMVNIHVSTWISAAAYVMCIFLCELLWWMHYSFPQNMVNTVRAWPEYHEMLKVLQVMVVDVKRTIGLLWELSLRGNVFNNW
jgi:hypothetical protein